MTKKTHHFHLEDTHLLVRQPLLTRGCFRGCSILQMSGCLSTLMAEVVPSLGALPPSRAALAGEENVLCSLKKHGPGVKLCCRVSLLPDARSKMRWRRHSQRWRS